LHVLLILQALNVGAIDVLNDSSNAIINKSWRNETERTGCCGSFKWSVPTCARFPSKAGSIKNAPNGGA